MEQSASDKNAIWLIIVISGLVQISSLIDRAYFTIPQTSNQSFPPHFIFDLNSEFNFNFSRIFTITGTVFLIAGTLFRLYAIKILGKYFSSTVQIKADHVITLILQKKIFYCFRDKLSFKAI
jgi:protein-S-isoprenylcysteine O-methyltransferase Ste14